MKLDKNKIDLLRAKNLWTTQQLAKEAGVSCTALCGRYDTGAVTAGKIARALGVDVEEIIVKEE